MVDRRVGAPLEERLPPVRLEKVSAGRLRREPEGARPVVCAQDRDPARPDVAALAAREDGDEILDSTRAHGHATFWSRGRKPHVWSRWLTLCLVGCLAGCGFRLVTPPLGEDQGAPPPDAGAPPDAAPQPGDGGSNGTPDGAPDAGPATGPGPLGALPAGFCCTADEQCRGRSCGEGVLGHTICLESCTSNTDCTHYSDRFFCYPQYQVCVQVEESQACLPPYVLGSKPTGSCCDPSAAHPGQECLGGWCIHSGAAENPYYCSQGCKSDADCPSGYSCDQPSAQCRHDDVVYTCS